MDKYLIILGAGPQQEYVYLKCKELGIKTVALDKNPKAASICFADIFVQASYEKCKERDVKGLYEKVNSGEIKDFTGDKSEFEQPNDPWLLINTENESQKISGEKILEKILKEIEI